MITQELAEGKRIQVQTKFFEGMATILYIAPGEFYPVQVELDVPDPDGHKIYRVAIHEVVNELLPESKPAAVTFEGPADPQKYLGEVAQESERYSFKKRERFLLGVVSYPGVFKAGPATNFYVYEPESMRFRGCMNAEMFRIIEPYQTDQPVPETPKTEQEPPKPLEKVVEASLIQDEVRYQQMSLLDFM